MLRLRWLVILLCCLAASFSIAFENGKESVDPPPDEILIEGGEVQLTRTELMLYLELIAIESELTIGDLSGQRVSQALLELYGLKTIDADAVRSGVYSLEMEAWLPHHLLAMHRVARFIDLSVARAMNETDWESEARDYYAGNAEMFQVAESVSIRTLLIRTSQRPLEEALSIANSLLTDRLPKESFESLVMEYSEDEVGRVSGGVMENVVKGDTVPSFEDAAFSLTQPGQLSPPVVSPFGVHLIKLLSKSLPRKASFDEVSADIISYLKKIRADEYRKSIQDEGTNREPSDFRINEVAIDAFMTDLGHAKMANEKFLMQGND